MICQFIISLILIKSKIHNILRGILLFILYSEGTKAQRGLVTPPVSHRQQVLDVGIEARHVCLLSSCFALPTHKSIYRAQLPFDENISTVHDIAFDKCIIYSSYMLTILIWLKQLKYLKRNTETLPHALFLTISSFFFKTSLLEYNCFTMVC